MTVFPPEVIARYADAGVDLEKLYSAGELGERMGIEVLEAAPERLTARMEVEGNRQPYGLLHGGASGVLVETLGSVGSMLHAGPGRIAVGVDLNATHHRSVRSGTVTAEATAIHLGRSTATYEVIVKDEEGRRLCTGRLTCLIRDEPKA
ncbi:hotdog fold thioesterase [Glycomyces sp. NPDC046736]|uniref:PaaI family thioesterase n=1 Tax=Glycomyces sp. NPDC046736 TaxID=3155615 RepID=UPI0033D8FA85